nr:lateral organ boundaries domain protein 49 [Ipomoea batatas]
MKPIIVLQFLYLKKPTVPLSKSLARSLLFLRIKKKSEKIVAINPGLACCSLGGKRMSSVGGPCGACKFLRRKCVKGCIFAPYFESDQLGTAHFAAVHKVFGASNASKMLMAIPANRRLEAVVTLCYEALARVRDPVYGCVGHIFTLQQQLRFELVIL